MWLSLARAPGLGPGGRRFESCHPDLTEYFQYINYARVAQGWSTTLPRWGPRVRIPSRALLFYTKRSFRFSGSSFLSNSQKNTAGCLVVFAAAKRYNNITKQIIKRIRLKGGYYGRNFYDRPAHLQRPTFKRYSYPIITGAAPEYR